MGPLWAVGAAAGLFVAWEGIDLFNASAADLEVGARGKRAHPGEVGLADVSRLSSAAPARTEQPEFVVAEHRVRVARTQDLDAVVGEAMIGERIAGEHEQLDSRREVRDRAAQRLGVPVRIGDDADVHSATS